MVIGTLPITVGALSRDRGVVGKVPINQIPIPMDFLALTGVCDRLIGVIGDRSEVAKDSNGNGGSSSRRLTNEETERVKRLIGEGMSPRLARAEVLEERIF